MESIKGYDKQGAIKIDTLVEIYGIQPPQRSMDQLDDRWKLEQTKQAIEFASIAQSSHPVFAAVLFVILVAASLTSIFRLIR